MATRLLRGMKKRGESPAVVAEESVMPSPIPEPTSREQRLQAILVAYLEAVERGQEPEPEAFAAQYPEFAAELARRS